MTPHELGPSGPIVAVAIAVVALAALAIIVRRLVLLFPGARVAEVEAGAREPHSFELRYVSTAARAYRLALRMRVHGQRWGQSTSTGVVCRLRVTVGGRLLVEEALGFGSDLPRPVDREITRGYRWRETKHGSEVVRTATYVLASIPLCPAGTEIVATGTFETGPSTETSMLDVFLGR